MKRLLQSALALATVIGVFEPTPAAAQPPAVTTGLQAQTARSVAFSWNPVAGATWYYLWVNDTAGIKYQHWYTSFDANCAPGQQPVCRVGVPLHVLPGNGIWWVQSYSDQGYGPWTAAHAFAAPGPYLAVVSSAGVLSRGNAVSASRLGLGTYEVVFGRDVTACAFTGNTGGINFEDSFGTISTARRGGVPNGVWLRTKDSAGTDVDRSFHLTVICP